MITRLFLSFILILSLAGCLFRQNLEGLLTLKRVGNSQTEIEAYLGQQEACFEKLLEDVENQRLKPGVLQEDFINSYGDPVLSRPASSQSSETVLLYRHPTRYFNSDKVYVYFNEDSELTRWEYKSCQRSD